MHDRWQPRCPPAAGLTWPVPIDPDGTQGPTRGQARGPYWRRSSPGLYVPASVDAALVEQRILEQAQRLPDGGAVTGWAALRLAGGGFFDGLAPDGRTVLPVPLLVAPEQRLRPDAGFVVVRSKLDVIDRCLLQGIPGTTAERAVLDELRWCRDLRPAITMIDMALVAGLTTVRGIGRMLAEHPGRPGNGLLRDALPHTEERSRSPMETAMRLVWTIDGGFPRPRCNWPIADEGGRYLGKPDLLCEELGVYGEFDGAEHRGRSRHRRDVAREDLFRRAGLEGFTIVGADLDDPALVVDRMRAAVARAAASSVLRSWRWRRDPGLP